MAEVIILSALHNFLKKSKKILFHSSVLQNWNIFNITEIQCSFFFVVKMVLRIKRINKDKMMHMRMS